jgi:hypothetical protein
VPARSTFNCAGAVFQKKMPQPRRHLNVPAPAPPRGAYKSELLRQPDPRDSQAFDPRSDAEFVTEASGRRLVYGQAPNRGSGVIACAFKGAHDPRDGRPQAAPPHQRPRTSQ